MAAFHERNRSVLKTSAGIAEGEERHLRLQHMCARHWHSVVEGAMVVVAACIPARLREQRDLEEGQEVAGVQTRSSRVERSH